MKISAFLPVYNEEQRIHYTLQSLQWCDEIIVLDKTSTDKTVSICQKFGATVIETPNSNVYESSEFNFLKKCSGDWIIIMTASDIIDKSLALEIRKQINVLSEDVGCIKVPFKNYILGIEDRRSPWHGNPRIKVFRNGNQIINNDVHGALTLKNYKSHTIPKEYGYFSHLTHVSLDMMLERHSRYWRGEAELYNHNSLKPAFKAFLKSVKETILKRKTFLLGWEGVALTFAYVSYFMFSFLYIWEHKRTNKAYSIYKKLRESNYEEWNDTKIEP